MPSRGRPTAHYSRAAAIAWSPNSALLASSGDDKKVVVHHAESGELVRVLAHDDSVNAITWMPDSALLASGCRDEEALGQPRQQKHSHPSIFRDHHKLAQNHG